MPAKLSDIERTVLYMDAKYDANFGSWIRNYRNASIVGHHLRKYVDDYSPADFIIVLKWIVRTWPLRSIIALCKAMLVEDIKIMNNRRRSESFNQLKTRVCIIVGLSYTWNVVFTVELLSAFMKDFCKEERIKLIAMVSTFLNVEKGEDLLSAMEKKVDDNEYKVMLKITKKRKRKGDHNFLKRRLLESFTVL